MKSSRGSPRTAKTVLVVDGDPKAGAQLAHALRRRGFDVASAATSAAALQSVRAVDTAAVVITLNPSESSSLLPLVRQLATDLPTQEIPVIVAHCEDDSVMAQAQRIGNVVVLLGDCSAETVAIEVGRVLLESAGRPAEPLPQFPVTCPHCAKQTGLPRSVSTAANRGTYICLRCESCTQQWRIFRQADAPGFVRI